MVAGRGTTPRVALREGLLSNLANPKMVVFFTSLLPQFGEAFTTLLAFGFAFLIFVGDANAREKSLVSPGFDKLAVLVIYLSWFGPLWWFGFSMPLIIVACGATTILCLIYAASYRAAAAR